jgi:hypothetical protein
MGAFLLWAYSAFFQPIVRVQSPQPVLAPSAVGNIRAGAIAPALAAKRALGTLSALRAQPIMPALTLKFSTATHARTRAGDVFFRAS